MESWVLVAPSLDTVGEQEGTGWGSQKLWLQGSYDFIVWSLTPPWPRESSMSLYPQGDLGGPQESQNH